VAQNAAQACIELHRPILGEDDAVEPNGSSWSGALEDATQSG
jgi:hypothetical protein